ncbi:bestrophin family ion channel [Pontibacter sp. G13]|uniref:bestrophin family protein n=1 Tax=Pontibacter sp. G13 TaxID=3074898 RepID=UPI00288BB057|nr:bestrophin family ion channel [Pontibacter sp. G13]WNJ20101.1 bestrophin family ion channel [Pontibacter sp. G13]
MLTKKRYSVKEMALWTRWETLMFLLFGLLVTILYEILGYTFLKVPWTPLAVIGTAVAFIIGFQNNAAYGRIWEARKIWGGIVNTSRTFGMKVQDMVSDEYAKLPLGPESVKEAQRILIYRHVAWLTALRHAMRQSREWEVFDQHVTNREWSSSIYIPERVTSLDDDLYLYLSPEERHHVMSKGNKATALLYLQSRHLRILKEQGLIWDFAFLNLENVLEELFTLQGKSERIKNFPYPRQYASLGYYFVWIFLILLPFGVVPEFAKIGEHISGLFPIIGDHFVWLSVPFIGIVSWVFHTMERIGRVGENPFEGTANDVPISTIARGIEIDIRQMLDESADLIPSQFPDHNHVQM